MRNFIHRCWGSALAVVTIPLVPLGAQKPGQPFVSPLKNFAVTVPNFAAGTQVKKTNTSDGGYVAFFGGFGALERIDYVRLDSAAATQTDSSGRMQICHAALDRTVTANRATLLEQEPLAVSGEPMLFALISFPGASTIMERGKRKDSVRGVLTLTKGGFLYMLMVQVGSLLSQQQEREEQQTEEGRRTPSATNRGGEARHAGLVGADHVPVRLRVRCWLAAPDATTLPCAAVYKRLKLSAPGGRGVGNRSFLSAAAAGRT